MHVLNVKQVSGHVLYVVVVVEVGQMSLVRCAWRTQGAGGRHSAVMKGRSCAVVCHVPHSDGRWFCLGDREQGKKGDHGTHSLPWDTVQPHAYGAAGSHAYLPAPSSVETSFVGGEEARTPRIWGNRFAGGGGGGRSGPLPWGGSGKGVPVAEP